MPGPGSWLGERCWAAASRFGDLPALVVRLDESDGRSSGQPVHSCLESTGLLSRSEPSGSELRTRARSLLGRQYRVFRCAENGGCLLVGEGLPINGEPVEDHYCPCGTLIFGASTPAVARFHRMGVMAARTRFEQGFTFDFHRVPFEEIRHCRLGQRTSNSGWACSRDAGRSWGCPT